MHAGEDGNAELVEVMRWKLAAAAGRGLWIMFRAGLLRALGVVAHVVHVQVDAWAATAAEPDLSLRGGGALRVTTSMGFGLWAVGEVLGGSHRGRTDAWQRGGCVHRVSMHLRVALPGLCGSPAVWARSVS
jgi:hypothetical protein